METSPDIQEKTVKEFNNAFSGKEGSKQRRRFEQLRKPDICDTIISANETRHKWYKELENVHDENDDELELQNKEMKIQEQERILKEKEKELKAFSDMENTKMQKQLQSMRESQKMEEQAANFYKEQCSLINKYIKTFEEIYERKPLKDEIMSNIGNQVDDKSLETFLKTYDTEMV
jgi:hypothetical protein